MRQFDKIIISILGRPIILERSGGGGTKGGDFGDQGPMNPNSNTDPAAGQPSGTQTPESPDLEGFPDAGTGPGASEMGMDAPPPGGAPPGGGMPGEGMEGQQGAPTGHQITTPAEFELGKLLVRALMFSRDTVEVDPRIFAEFEEKKGLRDARGHSTIHKVLGYVEHILNKSGTARPRPTEENELEVSEIQGQSIIDKLTHLDGQGPKRLDPATLELWTRVILNAIRNPNPSLVPDQLTPEAIGATFDRMMTDSNDARGFTYDGGKDITGPGVF